MDVLVHDIALTVGVTVVPVPLETDSRSRHIARNRKLPRSSNLLRLDQTEQSARQLVLGSELQEGFLPKLNIQFL